MANMAVSGLSSTVWQSQVGSTVLVQKRPSFPVLTKNSRDLPERQTEHILQIFQNMQKKTP